MGNILTMLKITKHEKYEIWMDSSDVSGEGFYRRMGRFFASRQIRKELEEPLSDDKNFRWLLVYKGYEIVGFACLNLENLEKRGEGWLTFAYILEDYRHNGLHSVLFQERLNLAKNFNVKVLRGVANEKSFELFVKQGFEIQQRKGKFTYFKKDLTDAKN